MGRPGRVVSHLAYAISGRWAALLHHTDVASSCLTTILLTTVDKKPFFLCFK